MTIISGIYKIENKLNGKVYIGSSKNIKQRFRQHLSDLKNNNHHSIHLQRSWNRYGKNNFEFSIIKEITYKNDLLTNEQYYIYKFDSLNKNKGYNIKPVCVNIQLNRKIIQKLIINNTIDLLELGILSILIAYVNKNGVLLNENNLLTQQDIIKLTTLSRTKINLILKHLKDINMISESTLGEDHRKKSYILNLDMIT